MENIKHPEGIALVGTLLGRLIQIPMARKVLNRVGIVGLIISRCAGKQNKLRKSVLAYDHKWEISGQTEGTGHSIHRTSLNIIGQEDHLLSPQIRKTICIHKRKPVKVITSIWTKECSCSLVTKARLRIIVSLTKRVGWLPKRCWIFFSILFVLKYISCYYDIPTKDSLLHHVKITSILIYTLVCINHMHLHLNCTTQHCHSRIKIVKLHP